ncbi:unnamed protein product [Effrenium voratum]|uniref:Uncharacterized protein n=1 Tax=Effrenium voratum TaxID=2562239 RepID=A0AA36N8W7_9DINO|nr:unnamed protein product [Effrenium voratum]
MGFAPAPPPPVDIENLTAAAFEEKVVKSVNRSEAAYGAIVLFHLDGEALPDFRQAKSRIEEGLRSGDVLFFRPIRFFLVDCSEEAELCRRYTSSFPCILSFREERMKPFNRPIHSEPLALWITRMARPSFFVLDTYEQWAAAQARPFANFLLIVAEEDQYSLEVWQELALENMEFHNYYVAVDDTGVWSALPGPRPSVHLTAHQDLQLDAPHFIWRGDKAMLRSWLAISALPVLLELTLAAFRDLPIGLPLVALCHSHNASALAAFRRRAQAMRVSLLFAFASLDIDSREGQLLARRGELSD